ncbi:MAG: hypothetical protein JWR07_3508 [Nevskia sp.]|nr:hypothetical protein [Nevskia sp.]
MRFIGGGLLAAAVFLLAACGSSQGVTTGSGGNGGGPTTASCAAPTPPQVVNQSVIVNVPSDLDPTSNPTPTTKIAFSLLLPARCPGDAFPLMLHSHGYGGSRLTTLATNGDLKPTDPMFASIDELTQALPYHGYVVISFDERGHGDSKPANGGGYARIIDPAAETQDARAILDWAYDNAAQYNIQQENNSGVAKDVKVATIGGSYGGGFQLPLAALDPRIDAIIPVGTWHDLLYSLLPGDAVKLAFDGLLCLQGADLGGVKNTPVVAALCNAVNVNNPLAFDLRSRANLANFTSSSLSQPRAVGDAELIKFFGSHGMNYFQAQQKAGLPWGYGESKAQLPKVPALFIQGNRDNLFNLTEAYWNQRYFTQAGGDVRMLSTEGGHMNPLANMTEGTADCGKLSGVNAALAWMDHYLKGVSSAAFDAIPKVCISVADTVGSPDVTPVGLLLDQFPVGSLSGTGAVPATLATLTANVSVLAISPVFVPVTTIKGSGQVLAGAPTIKSLTVAAGAGAIQATDAFVGVGIVRAGKTILVDDQVTAFGVGTHTSNRNVDEDDFILLPAIGERLQDGDQVGLLFYPQHIQYAAIVSAEGLSGLTGLVSTIAGVPIPPITSSLEPVLGLFYVDPYTVTANDIELPILVPGQYANSSLSQ